MASSNIFTYNNLDDEGYIIKDALSSEQAKELADELIDYTFNVLFEHRGYEIDRNHPLALNLLTDKNVRESLLNDSRSESVWEGGMSRKPIISKSCGMWHGHYNIKKFQMLDFNPDIFKISAEVIGTDKLVTKVGPERFSIKPGIRIDPTNGYKAAGATDMPKHIDSCLFTDTPNYPFRIQSLTCLSVGDDVSPRDSGTLNLLVNFHHYWTFARHLLNPQYGLVTMPECKSRFHTLPSDWDKKYLPHLIGHAKAYTTFLHDRKTFVKEYKADRQTFEFYEWLVSINVDVPRELKRIYWKPIVLKPGQMVFWHQHLPHQSLRNKSSTPRIVAYNNLFPVTEPEWYKTEERQWLVNMVNNCMFNYGIDNGVYPTDIKNKHELEYLQSTGKTKEVLDYIYSNPMHRRIMGIEEYEF